MPDQHKNLAYSTVATAPSPASSGTSLVVQSDDGAKFPGAPFNATVWPAGAQPTTANAEIVRVTVKSTDTFTITRAQESSSARTIIVGDQIAATITAKTLTDVETQSLDAIASANATAADWSNNSHKITSLANGTAAQDAAAFGQLPFGGYVGSMPNGAISATLSRNQLTQSSQTLTSGTLYMYGIYLPAGALITSVTFLSNTVPLSSGTHQIFGIFDDSLGSSSATAYALLRGTSDDTSTAWGASTAKTLNLTSTYTTTRSGFYYVGILVAATTPPNLTGFGPSAAAANLPSIAGGATTKTGLTALPNPANAPGSPALAYAYVS